MRPNHFLLLAALLGLSQCKKHDSSPAKPEDQLPPATQTGAGTFGCLLNEQPWTPQGYDGRPNFVLTYDTGYRGGALQIKCYRYTSSSTFQSIIFGAVNIAQAGTYLFSAPDNGISYFDTSLTAPCSLQSYSNSGTYRTGSLTITRLDLKAGIVAGTFNFKFAQPGCDTIKVTQGRFDYTL
ncbi:Riean_0653 family protein [Hymenobacter arcticus]